MVDDLKTRASLKSDNRGVTLVEYGLMAALIAVVCIVAVSTIGTDLSTVFSNIGLSIAAAS